MPESTTGIPPDIAADQGAGDAGKAVEKPHLSASALGAYLMCPRKWRFRYIDKIKGPVGSNLIFGNAFHTMAEFANRFKMENDGALPEYQATLEAFREDLHGRLNGKDEIQFADGHTPEGLFELGESMTEVYYGEILPTTKPIAVEQMFRVSIGDDFPYELLGYIDMVEEGNILVDLKTAGKRWAESKPDKEIQATLYFLAWFIETGQMPHEMRYDIVTKGGKRSSPAIQQLTTTRTEKEIRWFLRMVEEIVHGIVNKCFPPNNTGFLCSEKWCEYFALCQQEGCD